MEEDWFEYPCPLPGFDNIQWEKRTDKRGWVAQYAPQGINAPRRTKTYLGWADVNRTREWMALPASERRTAVAVWLAAAKAKKGLPQ